MTRAEMKRLQGEWRACSSRVDRLIATDPCNPEIDRLFERMDQLAVLLDGETKPARGVRQLLADESGATALEYGLLAAAVAGVLAVVAWFLGGTVSNTLSNVAAHLDG